MKDILSPMKYSESCSLSNLMLDQIKEEQQAQLLIGFLNAMYWSEDRTFYYYSTSLKHHNKFINEAISNGIIRLSESEGHYYLIPDMIPKNPLETPYSFFRYSEDNNYPTAWQREYDSGNMFVRHTLLMCSSTRKQISLQNQKIIMKQAINEEQKVELKDCILARATVFGFGIDFNKVYHYIASRNS